MLKKLFFVGYLCLAIPIYSFEPAQIAEYEANTWDAYYKKNGEEGIANLTSILRSQYQILDIDVAKKVSYKFAVALITFKTLPGSTSLETYNRFVLPLLTDAYFQLQVVSGSTWNYEEAAKADLDWWIARRNPQTNHPLIVGKKMEHLFVILFGNHDDGHFARAAYLRASAGLYTDLVQSMGKGVSKEDWEYIVSILEKAYTELKKGIEANTKEKDEG